MIHSILIIGQSNMAGRGLYADAEPLDNKGGRLKVLRNGRWQNMYRPVNPDRPFSGTCLVESFASAYADDHEGVEVGVIPCADGGTSLDQWQEGGLLFDNAINCARLAMRTSHLVAILWHQGEADCYEPKYKFYLEKVTAIMSALRRELGAENIPLIVGALGDYLVEFPDKNLGRNYVHVNAALLQFADATPCTAFVSAEGLGSNPDHLHFNHAALQEFGLRYYAEFRKLEDTERVFDEKCKMNDAVRSKMESL